MSAEPQAQHRLPCRPHLGDNLSLGIRYTCKSFTHDPFSGLLLHRIPCQCAKILGPVVPGENTPPASCSSNNCIATFARVVLKANCITLPHPLPIRTSTAKCGGTRRRTGPTTEPEPDRRQPSKPRAKVHRKLVSQLTAGSSRRHWRSRLSAPLHGWLIIGSGRVSVASRGRSSAPLFGLAGGHRQASLHANWAKPGTGAVSRCVPFPSAN
jgi:hypothetical protein